MADAKKVDVKKVADEVKATAAKAKDAAEKTVESAKTSAAKAKDAAEKTVESAKEATEKTAEKAKETTTKVKTTAKKAAAKKPASKKKAEVTKTAVLQFSGKDFKVDDIVAKAQEAFKAENKRKVVSDIKVYIKPEESAAYYVVTSGDSEYPGKIDL
jgi:septal ring-binding cell division protein DamX